MPLPTLTDFVLSTPISIEAGASALKLVMAAAGFTFFSEARISNGQRYLVYQCILDPTKTKGTVYFSVYFDDASNLNTILSITPPSLTNVSAADSLSPDQRPIFLTAINHPELRGFVKLQAGVSRLYGYIRPSGKPSWWEENDFAFVFLAPSVGVSLGGLGGADNPYNASGSYNFLSGASTDFRLPVPIVQERQCLSAPYILQGGGQGIAGKCSTDLAIVPSVGLPLFSKVGSSSSNSQYLTLGVNDPNTLAIKVS